ncbi:hypothetical protein [Microbacterium cremeum]|uniref:hypothetical protein n=1 Tax=Microbacterium cremeum TaxID=2782169 RepID=UPI001886F8B6|nr:hypothetical protein [Microbacterium cremeum]
MSRHRTSFTAVVAGVALVGSLLLAPGLPAAADEPDPDSEGVTISVEIAPLDCTWPPGKGPKPGKPGHAGRPGPPDAPCHPGNPDNHPGNPGNPGKPEKPEKPDKPGKPGKTDVASSSTADAAPAAPADAFVQGVVVAVVSALAGPHALLLAPVVASSLPSTGDLYDVQSKRAR